MGQYYNIVNIDKKEILRPHDYGCGAKLMEWSYISDDLRSNEFIGALQNLLQNDWKGDRVYVVGDYADKSYMESDIPDGIRKTMESLYKEFSWIGQLDKDGYEKTLYRADDESFKKLKSIESEKAEQYLCNSETKEYIDLKNLILEWTWKDRETGKERHTFINPISLLLAIGNGLGGGDYYSQNNEYVGYWVPYSKGIFYSSEKPLNYKELKPNFHEQ